MRIIIIMAIAGSMFVACNNSGNKVQTADEQQVLNQSGTSFYVDTLNSSLQWKGFHKGGLNPRFGILNVEGKVYISQNKLSAGSFTIDMNSVKTDEKSIDLSTTGGKTAADMDAHLKNADFFETDKYPVAKFELTNVLEDSTTKGYYIVSGNLSLKDKTVNIQFPAQINISEQQVQINANFTINRKDWGLSYGTEGDPRDWLISKDVEITLNINANK
ncbi:YceI family protein [Empedobacter falsenii]|uniref:Uncharacterized conserved protein n=2 Tax=Weeksellaceae TaxID=2762318 RepID=A0A376GDN2_9FLAO|nr:YceI family protein [Empedobacter falsenii]MDM1133912.1 YceI family protein [Empedobacter sp. R750]STD58909.1 Uncharacterized conserved protein [Empedobacter falsenii]